MMPDSAFDQLAEEAAAGLQGDDELFLDVKQELRGHLEDKADDLRGQGHSEEESDELARKAFGSPLAVAAELVAANAGRMRLRTLARLVFLLLVVPLAVVLALYVGYNRFVGLSYTFTRLEYNGPNYSKPLPNLLGSTFCCNAYTYKAPLVEQLASGFDNAANLRKFWEDHRQDADAPRYYAYYALYAQSHLVFAPITDKTMMPATQLQIDDAHYIAEMRQGERIEPLNALYNVLLAEYYLRRGITAKSEKASNVKQPLTDDVPDRRAFLLGIAELRKAVVKPYLQTYHENMMQLRFNALPPPLLTEDYLEWMTLAVSESLPELARYREMARKIPGCARVLLAEGHRADAEAVMDTWKPLIALLMSDSRTILISPLVACAAGHILAHEGAEVYDQMGATAKARDARTTEARLNKLTQDWRSTNADMRKAEEFVREHGAYLAKFLVPFGGSLLVTEADLQPSRMHEHALIDEVLVEVVVLLLIVGLLVTLLEGACWFLALRKRGARPLLLLPAGELCRALLLGIALPVAIYWVYSRLPVIGGREYSWFAHWPRFTAEWLCLAGVIGCLPAFRIFRYIDRRCAELGIAIPSRGRVWWNNVRLWAMLLLAVGIGLVPTGMERIPEIIIFGGLLPITLVIAAFYAFFRVKKWPLVVRIVILALAVGLGEWVAYSGTTVNRDLIAFLWLLLACAVAATGFYLYVHTTGKYRRYYGTVVLSLAPLFAFSALFLSLVVQPFFIANEAYWLRRDTALWNHFSLAHQHPVGLSSIEEEATTRYLASLDQAMKGK